MKLTLISDTHGQNLNTKWEIPPCDIAIHAGDLTTRGKESQFVEAAKHLSRLPAWLICYVPGNHDKLAAEDPEKVQDILGPRIRMMIDDEFVLDGIKFFGSPWLPMKPGQEYRAFNRESNWTHIPNDTDVLITHCPPWGVLDVAERYWKVIENGGIVEVGENEVGTVSVEQEHIGDTGLVNNILYRVMPQLHVFGHNHEGYGMKQIDNTTFVNASLVDRNYKPANEPIEWVIL